MLVGDLWGYLFYSISMSPELSCTVIILVSDVPTDVIDEQSTVKFFQRPTLFPLLLLPSSFFFFFVFFFFGLKEILFKAKDPN